MWNFNGTNLSSTDWKVQAVLDGLGHPGFRGEDLQVPFEDGRRRIKKRYNSRIIVFSMYVKGVTEETFESNIDILSRLFGARGQHTLKRTLANGEIREAKAEVYNKVNFPIEMPNYSKFSVEFELADPFFYGTDLTSQTKAIGSTDVTWTHNNPGTAPVTKAVITFNGPLDSPRFENLSNEIWLNYQGAIAAGETVVINTADFTCAKDGVNMISAIKHGGDAYWFTLESDNNSMKLTSEATGGSIKIEYYPAYF
jgi:hypothetical protein